ncbi:MAG: MoaD/ThiS family protein [Gemmatimonadaceae bacterium]
MEITVRLFAAYADALGASHTTVQMPEPATVGALRAALAGLSSRLPPRPIIAVNAEYANDDRRITERDEVAVIPPVSGG